MRRGQRAGGLGAHTRSLLAQTGLQTADPAAALSLLISKPRYRSAWLCEEIDAQCCKKFRDTLLIFPNNYVLHNLKLGSGINNSCQPGPILRSLPSSLYPYPPCSLRSTSWTIVISSSAVCTLPPSFSRCGGSFSKSQILVELFRIILLTSRRTRRV